MSSINPAHANKVDISTLSPDEQRIFRMYGRLPSRHDLVANRLKERKYFDSGDYALSKAGRAESAGVTSVGSMHPLPQDIPHSPGVGPQGSSPSASVPVPAAPAKESGLVHEIDEGE
ncbi:camp-regulated phosphoprotein/endosulfine conserved region-domain-containing protein [Limtongia smithiae]|uniref:camp-regulated phosphoprotein/endosulfine conserved region-domain-containing protein n=1 Tax=Limtongia smithiae TaxID=1125753 RepID=UPI0034CECCFE